MADVNISKYRASVVRDGSKPSSPGFVVSEGQDPVNPPGTNNFVPYSGATANVDLGEFGLETGFVTLDTTPTGTPTTQGTIYWDADDETVDVILNGYTMKIGEDLFYPVKNQTGSTIAKGTAVRFAGTLGSSGRLLIAPFIANGTVPSSLFMGVTAEEILNGEDGKVLYFGRVRGINTDAFNEGDILYASTTVAGGYQTAIPLPPNNIVQVAAVVTKSINQGTIFVRPTLGSNINTDEGVKITSVADKNLLQYQSGTGLWENKTLAQVLGGTASQFVKGNGSLDSTSYQPLLTNPVTGTGTTNYLAKFTSGSTIGDSQIFDNGVKVAIGLNPANNYGAFKIQTLPTGYSLDIVGKSDNNGSQISFLNNTQTGILSQISSIGLNLYLSTGGNYPFFLSPAGNFIFGSYQDNGARLQVSGTATVSGIGYFGGATSLVTSTGILTSSSILQIFNGGGAGSNIDKISDVILANYSSYTDGSIGRLIGVNTAITTADKRIAQIAFVNNGAINSGQISFATLNAGTFSTKMILTSSGNVLIGTTTDNGARLQVSGTATITGSTNQQLVLDFTTASGGFTWQSFRLNGTNRYRIFGNTDNSFTLYSDILSSNVLSIASTGAATFSSSVTAASLISAAATFSNFGSATAAVVAFADGNTGFFRPALNTLGITTAGVERLRITSSGSVGIGNTIPDSFFSAARNLVVGTGSGNNGMSIYSGSSAVGDIAFADGTTDPAFYSGLIRYDHSLDAMRFFTASVEKLRITSGGFVGIANSSPSYFLDVIARASGEGGVRFWNNRANTGTIDSIALNLHVSNSIGQTGGKIVVAENTTDAWPTNMQFWVNGASSSYSPTQAMTITSSGNVGIGTTTPGARLDVTTSFGSQLIVGFSNNPDNFYDANNHFFRTAFGVSNTLSMINGNVLIGTTTDAGSKLRINQSGIAWAQIIDHSNASAQFYIDFRYNGTGTGSIIGYGTYTNFNTTSDYRLKEDLKQVNGLEKIKAINIYNYKWKESETRMDGVLAHELAEVLPYAVTGVKDGEEMQSVDYSKIVPLLIQSIKELKQEIDTLKN